MSYDTIFDFIDQDKTRFVFTYQDKDMERQVYDKHVELKVVGLSGSQSPTDLVVAANLPAVDYKHFPLVDVNTGSLILTLLTGEEFKPPKLSPVVMRRRRTFHLILRYYKESLVGGKTYNYILQMRGVKAAHANLLKSVEMLERAASSANLDIYGNPL